MTPSLVVSATLTLLKQWSRQTGHREPSLASDTPLAGLTIVDPDDGPRIVAVTLHGNQVLQLSVVHVSREGLGFLRWNGFPAFD